MLNGKTNINHHVYHIHYDSGFKNKRELKFSLGNFTDTGWFWSGSFEEKTFLLWLARLATANIHEDEKMNVLDFDHLQDYYRIAVNDPDQLNHLAYYLSGDNGNWHFGEGEVRFITDQLVERYCNDHNLDYMTSDIWVDFDLRELENAVKGTIVEVLQGNVQDSFYNVQPLPDHVSDFLEKPDLWQLHHDDLHYLISDSLEQVGYTFEGNDIEPQKV